MSYFWGFQGVRLCCLGALDHGGGWKRPMAVGGFCVTGFSQILLDLASVLLDLAKFNEHVGHDHLLKEGSQNKLPKATPGLLLRFLGGSSRQTSALPSGPFFLVAVAPPQPPN